MKHIFIDMDGVLSDFQKKYQQMFDITTQEMKDKRDRKKYDQLWNTFLDQREFAKLEWFPGGEQLIEYMRTLNPNNIQIAILSSSGGFDRQREVQEQKLAWLTAHFIDWPAVIVPGRRYKAGFAREQSIMIDDTPDVCTEFIKAGGAAIEHTEWRLTKPLLEMWLADE
jgi:hypothetical protein